MPSEKPQQDLRIMVAVPFNEQSAAIVESAGKLALRTGMALDLLHVAQPPIIGLASSPFNMEMIAPNVLRAIEGESLDAAEAHLRELAASLPRGVKATQKAVVSRSVPETILAESERSGATMIFCGAGGHASGVYKIIPQGFSTALTLMANASVPVVAIRSDMPIHFDDEALRLLVADDLREAGHAAIHFALSWALGMEKTQIRHVHINDLLREEFMAAADAMIAASQDAAIPPLDAEAIYAELQQQLRKRLDDRVAELRELIERMPRNYEVKLASGLVSEGLAQEAELFGASLLVFGRHAAVHHKPFGIGQVSYRTMLQQHYPVMVVPLPCPACRRRTGAHQS